MADSFTFDSPHVVARGELCTLPTCAELAGSALMPFRVPYFYRGIAYYSGRVLKCQGIATRENIAHLIANQADGDAENWFVLSAYAGDRVVGETLQRVTGI